MSLLSPRGRLLPWLVLAAAILAVVALVYYARQGDPEPVEIRPPERPQTLPFP